MHQPAEMIDNFSCLRSIIEDRAIAWDATCASAESAIFQLSGDVLRELDANRPLLGEAIPVGGRAVVNAAFPALKREIATLRENMLEGGLGFAIVRGLTPERHTPIEMENVFWRLCNELGAPFSQKAPDVRFGRVEDLNLPAQARPRYHETGAGGSVHTDSPIMPRVADFVGLLCVRAAGEGGRSKFVSVATVHNILLRHAEDLLLQLYRPFVFDRRILPSEASPDNPALLRMPIFTYDEAKAERGLMLRWQPEYVWQAPQLSGVPALSEKQRLALHLLEGVLEDRAEAITLQIAMQPGDIQLLNNHVVAHGRTAFVDHRLASDPAKPDPERRRLMRRVWMRRDP